MVNEATKARNHGGLPESIHPEILVENRAPSSEQVYALRMGRLFGDFIWL
jgi:hypothetical protein